MTEWPDAPRLTDALNSLASRTRIDESRRHEVASAIASTDPIVRPMTSRDHSRPTTRRRQLVVAFAVAVVLVGGMAAIAVVRHDSAPAPGDRVPEPPPPSAATTPAAATPVASYEAAEMCTAPSGELEPRSIAADGDSVEVGVHEPDAATQLLSVISVGPTADWREQAARDRLAEAEFLSFHVGGAGVPQETTAAAVDRIVGDAPCGAPVYLAATGGGFDLATGVACNRTARTGFRGYLFVEPGPPPASCELPQPTIILTAEPDRETIDSWRRSHGCSGPVTTTDGSGNTTTTYSACDTTLIVIDTSTPDPWAADLDGEHPSSLLELLYTTPR